MLSLVELERAAVALSETFVGGAGRALGGARARPAGLLDLSPRRRRQAKGHGRTRCPAGTRPHRPPRKNAQGTVEHAPRSARICGPIFRERDSSPQQLKGRGPAACVALLRSGGRIHPPAVDIRPSQQPLPARRGGSARSVPAPSFGDPKRARGGRPLRGSRQ